MFETPTKIACVANRFRLDISVILADLRVFDVTRPAYTALDTINQAYTGAGTKYGKGADSLSRPVESMLNHRP